jgi:crotonobetainyl-CoA:carnitine CoA-transferase CaiB-like acyl-CoA transferase
MTEQGLSGVKVLDLTWHIAGPYCTKYLADSGAEVIKVEMPGTGDPARQMSPFYKDDPHPEKSGIFLHLNTSKKGVTLNLRTDTGVKIFKELVKAADILVESFRPHVMPGLGLGYPELEKINPRLVMTSISSFGQTGPYREYKATDMIMYGIGGAMYWTGVPSREPVRLGDTVVSCQVGVMASVATTMALYGAEIRGYGEHIDFAAYESIRGSIDRAGTDCLAYQYSGTYDKRAPSNTRSFPNGVYPCKDGYFDLSGGGVVFFPRVCRMIGRPELAKDPRYCTAEAQIDIHRKEEFDAEIFYPWILERTRKEVWAEAQASNILSGPVFNSQDLYEDEHYQGRNYWQEVEHPVTGKLLYPGATYRSEEMPWKVSRPAPLLGQHNEEVYGALGYTKEDLVRLRESGVI